MSRPLYDTEHTQSQFFFKEQSDYYPPEDAPILVALDLQTPANVGSFIRLAGNMGCKKLLFTGKQADYNTAKIKRTATTAFNQVDWQFVEHRQWHQHIPEDYQIVAVETTAEATSVFSADLKGKFAFVLGNERYGIDKESLEHCAGHLYIPLPGKVKSLNVVQAATVVLFEWLRANLHK